MSTTQAAPAAAEMPAPAAGHCSVAILRTGHVEIVKRRRCHLSPRGQQEAQAAALSIDAMRQGRTVAVVTEGDSRSREAGEIIAAYCGGQAQMMDCLDSNSLSTSAGAIRQKLRQSANDSTLLVIVANRVQVKRLTGQSDPAQGQIFYEDWTA